MLRLWTGATHSHFEERPTRCLATLGSSRSVAHGEMDASSSGVMQTTNESKSRFVERVVNSAREAEVCALCSIDRLSFHAP